MNATAGFAGGGRLGERPSRERIHAIATIGRPVHSPADEDLELLEVVLHLTRDLGVNLAGVEIVLNMRAKMSEMQRQIEEFVSTLNQEMASRNWCARLAKVADSVARATPR